MTTLWSGRVVGKAPPSTDRASEIIRPIGYVTGGLPGQRLLNRLSIATSDDTVLRRVRDKPVQNADSRSSEKLGCRRLGVA